MRLVVLPVQYRTIAEALSASVVDLAVTVADELPADTRRLELRAHDRRLRALAEHKARDAFAAEDLIAGEVEEVGARRDEKRCKIPLAKRRRRSRPRWPESYRRRFRRLTVRALCGRQPSVRAPRPRTRNRRWMAAGVWITSTVSSWM